MVYKTQLYNIAQRQAKALAREEEIARLYVRGMTQYAIAEKLGTTRDAIKNIIVRVQKRWKEAAIASYDEKMSQQLAKYDAVESAAWEGWERSLKNDVTKSVEKIDDADGTTTKKKKQESEQAGNPAFLAVINKTIENRCRLLGLLDRKPEDEAAMTAGCSVVSIVVNSREEADGLRTLTVDQYQQKLMESKQPK